MYPHLLSLHSFVRWLVLFALVLSIVRACRGYYSNSLFTRTDNAIRHWTATVAHIQLMVGMVLYFQSPVIKYFWSDVRNTAGNFQSLFFGLIHILFMITAIVFITVGSSLAKRQGADKAKFKTMLTWYSIALVIIFIAVPWPFSPFANRPYFR